MQNKQNTIYRSFQADEHRRISRWKQIKIVYRLIRLTYRVVRSEIQLQSKKLEKNLKHLKAILKCLMIPPTNPFHYWVNRQLGVNTSGTKFNTNWY